MSATFLFEVIKEGRPDALFVEAPDSLTAAHPNERYRWLFIDELYPVDMFGGTVENHPGPNPPTALRRFVNVAPPEHPGDKIPRVIVQIDVVRAVKNVQAELPILSFDERVSSEVRGG